MSAEEQKQDVTFVKVDLVWCGQVMIRRGQDYITSHLPSVHRDMAGISPPDARVQYIRDLSEPPAKHNMHFYRLRRRKYDPVPGNDWLAICPKGLEIYEVSELDCTKLSRAILTQSDFV